MSSSIPKCNISIDGENYYNPDATDIRGPLGRINVDDEIKINAGLLVFFIIIYAFTRSFISLLFLILGITGLGLSIYKKITINNSIRIRPCIDIDGTTLTKN
jgi:hypothetical protein